MWKKLLFSFLLALFLFISDKKLQAIQQENKDEVDKIEAARTMRIYAFQIGYVPDRKDPESIRFCGSGVVVSPKGHILTCKHVVEQIKKNVAPNAPDFVVAYLLNPKQVSWISASLYYEDPKLDVAILKSDFESYHFKDQIHFGDSSKVSIASDVSVCGYPYPYGRWIPPYVFSGIVSNIYETDGGFEFYTDIESYPGLSGSPVFLSKTAEIIGMLQGHYNPQGIPTSLTLFIPINSIKPILEKELNRKEQ
jgi:S1-C subfamily serine protease